MSNVLTPILGTLLFFSLSIIFFLYIAGSSQHMQYRRRLKTTTELSIKVSELKIEIEKLRQENKLIRADLEKRIREDLGFKLTEKK